MTSYCIERNGKHAQRESWRTDLIFRPFRDVPELLLRLCDSISIFKWEITNLSRRCAWGANWILPGMNLVFLLMEVKWTHAWSGWGPHSSRCASGHRSRVQRCWSFAPQFASHRITACFVTCRWFNAAWLQMRRHCLSRGNPKAYIKLSYVERQQSIACRWLLFKQCLICEKKHASHISKGNRIHVLCIDMNLSQRN